MKTKIIVSNPGGIANRLKCLISMWRLSDKYNKKLYLHWVKNNRCGAEFEELFENKFSMINKEELDKLPKEDYMISETWRFLTLPEEVPDNFAEAYPTKRGNNIDCEFHRIPLEIRQKILHYLSQLVPVKEIKNGVKWFEEKYDLSQMVGVHIRRGDFLVGKEGLGKVSSDEKFVEKMESMLIDNPSLKFFLCTDGPEVEDKFLKKFGGKIVIYPKMNRDRTSLECTQDGLVDLLLLSKTKHIVGTYRSTFNELAWWFGGCKAKVDIVIDDDLNKKYEIKNIKMKKSMYQKFKKSVYQFLCKIRFFKK